MTATEKRELAEAVNAPIAELAGLREAMRETAA